jgi:hypothetical protein
MGMTAVAVAAFAWLAQAPSYPPPPPPPPPAEVVRPRYGDRGTSDLSLGLGYGADGLIVGAGYRRFFWPGIAPGIEGNAQLGGQKVGLVLGSLRVVPLRMPSVALALTPKGGRVLLSNHGDGWALGGDAGVLVAIAQGAAVELGYEVLRLLPASFCADLSSCVVHRPVLGLRLMF